MRVFTRADVVAFFERSFVHYEGGVVYQLENVELLPDFPTGAWLVDFVLDVGRKFKTSHQLIIVQIDDELGPTRPYLRLVDHQDLPLGCATVAEEDELLRKP